MEAAAFGAELDDSFCGGGADAGQLFEFFYGGGVEVNWCGGRVFFVS
jgi:hypothetical protein